MDINYENFKDEVMRILEENKIWVLSTSYKDKVTSRSMSIVNKGLKIYFQTDKSYIKYEQMKKNKNVSLCFNNISIEAIAEEIGNWKDDNNKELMEIYKKFHLNSFKNYGLLPGEVVFRLAPKIVKMWKYVDGKPVREILYVEEKKAEQLIFM